MMPLPLPGPGLQLGITVLLKMKSPSTREGLGRRGGSILSPLEWGLEWAQWKGQLGCR